MGLTENKDNSLSSLSQSSDPTSGGGGDSSPPSTSSDENIAFDNLSHRDLKSILMGDSTLGLTGYFNYQNAVNIKESLDLDFCFDSLNTQSIIEPKEFLKEFEENYKEHADQKSILLYNEDYGYLRLPYVYRGSGHYRAELIDKIDKLGNWVDNNGLNLIHIRLSPKTYDSDSSLRSLMDLRNIKNNLLTALRSKLGTLNYLMTLEPNKKGHAHIHLLVFTKKNYLIDKSWLDRYWKDHSLGSEAGVWINSVKSRNGSDRNTIKYAMKYITKTHDNKYWSGLLRLTRTRSFTASQKVSSVMSSQTYFDPDFLDGMIPSLAVGRLTQTRDFDFVGCFRSWVSDYLDSFPKKDPPSPDELKSFASHLRWVESLSREDIQNNFFLFN